MPELERIIFKAASAGVAAGMAVRLVAIFVFWAVERYIDEKTALAAGVYGLALIVALVVLVKNWA